MQLFMYSRKHFDKSVDSVSMWDCEKKKKDRICHYTRSIVIDCNAKVRTCLIAAVEVVE